MSTRTFLPLLLSNLDPSFCDYRGIYVDQENERKGETKLVYLRELNFECVDLYLLPSLLRRYIDGVDVLNMELLLAMDVNRP
jgi:hypothetical protein